MIHEQRCRCRLEWFQTQSDNTNIIVKQTRQEGISVECQLPAFPTVLNCIENKFQRVWGGGVVLKSEVKVEQI